ncbi:MAG: DUF4869 domain-containing protein [Lachnospiraceae bacterium]|nr:DUF4869 domain-containing protein [Lachnospiraceae bacterium]
MLHIFYGNMPEAIYNTTVYFKNTYLDEWITDPLDREMIADVDQSTVIDSGIIDSPFLGKIPPLSLSGGVKTLMLIHHIPDKVFNASQCGDNCAKWILKMAEDREVTINLRHLMDFGKGPFDIEILNTGQIVHNSLELLLAAGNLVQ